MEKDLSTILREEAELFDAEDDDEVAEAVWVRPKPAKAPTMVYSVRIPVSEVEKLRQVAAAVGKEPSALMREWALERLHREYAETLGHCPTCGHDDGGMGHLGSALVAAELLRDSMFRLADPSGLARGLELIAAMGVADSPLLAVLRGAGTRRVSTKAASPAKKPARAARVAKVPTKVSARTAKAAPTGTAKAAPASTQRAK